MSIIVIKAKATLDVGYCASSNFLADVSKNWIDVDEMFDVFAIARNWVLKTELAMEKLAKK